MIRKGTAKEAAKEAAWETGIDHQERGWKMTLDELKQRRIQLGFSYQELSELSKVPLGTIQKVFGGITSRPRRETILKLEGVLGRREHQAPLSGAVFSREYQEPVSGTSFPAERRAPKAEVRDAAAAYQYEDRRRHVPNPETNTHEYDRQGEYTLEDYYALPEEQRVELINGVFYDMGTPASPHQIIGGDIYSQLLLFRNSRKGPCLPRMSPVDVQLDRNNRTMVQPDVIIVCDRSKITYKGIFGAPDFIVEILSPSTRKKDMTLKMSKYIDAGVREYWMIDPRTGQVVVYDFEHEQIPAIYTFKDKIPVGIWGGECKVDLSGTAELLDELFPAETVE